MAVQRHVFSSPQSGAIEADARRRHRPSFWRCGAAVVWLLLLIAPSLAANCTAELQAIEPDHCQFFQQYRSPGSVAVDARLSSRVLEERAGTVRSFALVIGIYNYPNFAPELRVLDPARNDTINLVAFLRNQLFDEIIVLENENATKANIDYFLDDYLNRQLDIFGSASRVLIAHTGHGGPGGSPANAGSIILSAANGMRDYPHTYPLTVIAPKLKQLADKSFHFVALLGSCFSGGVFSLAGTGGANFWNTKMPGGHVLTSTPHDDFAYGLAKDKGSLFFDSLIRGVQSGMGDQDYAGWAGSDGNIHYVGNGIIRFGALASYISSSIEKQGMNPLTRKPFPQIVIGSLSGGDRSGALFFLSEPPKEPQVSISVARPASATLTNDNAVSLGLPGVRLPVPEMSAAREPASVPAKATRPTPKDSSLKVFNPPDSYAAAGIDVSHHNGKIDWPQVAKAKYRFAYMKATESVTMRDNQFAANWAGAKAAGLLHGAYHVFDFCLPVERQLENIKQAVPKEADSLPPALDLVWFDGPQNPRQKQCGDVANTRKRLLQLASGLEQHYGKTPIIFANRSGLNDLLDDSFLHYPIWLQSYQDANTDRLENLKVKGSNPWTIWQHTSKGAVPGIRGNVDLNVFFGSRRALEDYAKGAGGNPALQAARQ